MRIRDLKVGDKVKFGHCGRFLTGTILFLPCGLSPFTVTVGETKWWVNAPDIVSKIEEKETPIDEPFKNIFEFYATESLIDYVWKAGQHVPVGYIGGRTEGAENVRLPINGNLATLSGKKFKVTVEEIE
jgi:hypothetical protein